MKTELDLKLEKQKGDLDITNSLILQEIQFQATRTAANTGKILNLMLVVFIAAIAIGLFNYILSFTGAR